MELGDRIFYSVLSLILIGLFWLKFIEPNGLSIYWSLIAWGQVSAAGAVVSIPVLILVFILQKHLVRGLTLGAVTG